MKQRELDLLIGLVRQCYYRRKNKTSIDEAFALEFIRDAKSHFGSQTLCGLASRAKESATCAQRPKGAIKHGRGCSLFPPLSLIDLGEGGTSNASAG